VLAVIVAIVGGAGYYGYSTLMTNSGQPSCRAVALGHDVSFTPEQSANAATITAIALQRGLPARAATIANATAIQESKLRNIRFGDRDSLGLFQQRPSQGWGTEKQILDPVYATNKFYDALTKISGYQTMEITKVAQLVQRSATPQAYGQPRAGRAHPRLDPGRPLPRRLRLPTERREDQHAGSHHRHTAHRRAWRAGCGAGTGHPRDRPQRAAGLGRGLVGGGTCRSRWHHLSHRR